MGCEEYREMLSAMLDGQDAEGERPRVEEHLANCRQCRQWSRAAATVTRLARTSPAAAGPAVPDSVLDAAPGPGRARMAQALRGLLGALGTVQLGLGLVQVTGFGEDTLLHDGHSAAATAADHLWHESAAWNVAVGTAFLWIALRRYPPTGVLPILTTFVATLTLLSTTDVIAGRVETGRLVSHALVLTGYAVILALTRPGLDFGEPPAGPGRGFHWWRLRLDTSYPSATSGPAARPVEGIARSRRAA